MTSSRFVVRQKDHLDKCRTGHRETMQRGLPHLVCQEHYSALRMTHAGRAPLPAYKSRLPFR